MDGLPQLHLWEEIVMVMTDKTRPFVERKLDIRGIYDIAAMVDYVPTTLPDLTDNARLVCLEDNDAVIKMIIKGRTNKLRHVVRTHRINLDWLFEVLREDPGVSIKYINTKRQVADIFAKGQFTSQQFLQLLFLCNIARSSKQSSGAPASKTWTGMQNNKPMTAANASSLPASFSSTSYGNTASGSSGGPVANQVEDTKAGAEDQDNEFKTFLQRRFGPKISQTSCSSGGLSFRSAAAL